MTTFAIICLLVGAVLGQRFKVLILLPTITIALFFIILAGIAHAATVGWTAMMAVIAITGIQIGYFVGIGIRHVIVIGRAIRSPATSLTRSAPYRLNSR
jgi:hypothetical protein